MLKIDQAVTRAQLCRRARQDAWAGVDDLSLLFSEQVAQAMAIQPPILTLEAWLAEARLARML
ncbi:hypothetical protein D3C76_1437000 [compost metagenome]